MSSSQLSNTLAPTSTAEALADRSTILSGVVFIGSSARGDWISFLGVFRGAAPQISALCQNEKELAKACLLRDAFSHAVGEDLS
jgi:hypothetical protein